MAEEQWEEVNPMSTPIWEFQKAGDEVVGILEKVEENVGPNKSRLYTLKKEDGSLVKVWGSTLLDKRFDFISLGEKVKIVYEGKKKSEKSKRAYNDFKVFHAHAKHPENKLDEDIPTVEESQEEETEEDIPF